jgi:hypothetical protein
MPSTTKRTVATIVAAGALLASAVGATTASAATVAKAPAKATAAAGSQGCPSGAFCIYPRDKGFNGGHPELVYYSYGAHNLSNVLGMHAMYNNQTGGAGFKLCFDYGGGRCTGNITHVGGFVPYDFTPINSIVLTRP